MATPAAALGAMLADVDFVLMGAGVLREIPRLLTDLSEGRVGGVSFDVHGADAPERVAVEPQDLLGVPVPALRRPLFLAIVSAAVLATYLARDDSTRPDGFVIEGSPTGGHYAPSRGKPVLDEDGQPAYGKRDEVDLTKVAALDRPSGSPAATATRTGSTRRSPPAQQG